MSKNKKAIIASGAILLAVGGGVIAGVVSSSKNEMPENSAGISGNTNISASDTTSLTEYTFPEDTMENWDNTVLYNGQTYVLRDDIKTILFMGVDRTTDLEYEDVSGGGGCADTIMILFVDETNKKIDILELSRETMTEVDVYNFDRDFLYSGNMQLCLQYSFSDSARRGSLLMCDKVSEILFNTNIDNYCTLTVEGMASIVDVMGGIEVTFDTDYSYINPSYTVGSTVTMNSDDVNAFVRYRDTEVSGSNNERMERQTWFVRTLIDTISANISSIPMYYEAAGDELCSDMDAETMAMFASYSIDSVTIAPGTPADGEFHDEFYIDEIALRELLIGYLYEEE